MKQRLLVRAHFTDGHVEDVTRWVKFTSSNESVAAVDQLGNLNVMGEGEGFVSGWYLSQNVVATITVPYQRPVDAKVFAEAPRRNFIDELVLKQLAAAEPSAIAAGRRRGVSSPRVHRHDRHAADGRRSSHIFERPIAPTSATS